MEYDTSNPASTVGRSSGASGLVGSPPGQPAGRVSLSMGNVITNPLRDTDANLMQRQRDVMKMQDSALLDIGKGVDRLHDQVGDAARYRICQMYSLVLYMHILFVVLGKDYWGTSKPTKCAVKCLR